MTRRLFGTSVLWLVLCLFLPMGFESVFGQTESTRKRLRASLSAAVDKDFEILQDEPNISSNAAAGGTYWLVQVRPRHSGYFQFRYRYKYKGSSYSHVERVFSLRVGERGCRRRAQGTGHYAMFCAGDTIILPIGIDKFTEHEFDLTSTAWNKENEEPFEEKYPEQDQRLTRGEVTNPAAENLKYIGSGSHRSLHRAGGYTLEFYAVFEAVRPGRFNLILDPPVQRVSLQQDAGGSGVPVIVVERDKPLTLLASREHILGYRAGFDGREYESSSSGNDYVTNVLILQPGDRISLTYQTIRRSRDYEFSTRNSEDPIPSPPVIRKAPFAVDPEWSYNAWVMKYLGFD